MQRLGNLKPRVAVRISSTHMLPDLEQEVCQQFTGNSPSCRPLLRSSWLHFRGQNCALYTEGFTAFVSNPLCGSGGIGRRASLRS